MSIPVITIDGPSGSGKGTLSLRLAKALGWNQLDSGALYRILAFAAQRKNIPTDSEELLMNLLQQIRIEFTQNTLNGNQQVLLNGEDVSLAIRSEQCGVGASTVAALPRVRTALIDKQRQFRQAPGLVTDGRDMGTVIFPDAPLKIFLLASAEERAKRRYFQLKQRGDDVKMRAILDGITERDQRDSNRQTAPLKPADDAICLDTTTLDIEQVFEKALLLAKEKFGGLEI